MAKVLVTESYLEDIGDAIRAKLETQDTYKPSQMANAISQISGGTLITKSITQNGTYNASDDEADGYSSVTVNVAGGGGSGPILSGTTEPTSAIGNNEDIYIKYSEMAALYDHSIKIDAQYRKVNGVWVNYTEPEAPTKGVHIWTKSTGGNDAAMYVQDGYWDVDNEIFVTTGDVVSVIYTIVQSSNTYNCNGVATLGYPSNWIVRATDNVTDGTNNFVSGDVVNTWRYNVSVDFYVWRRM